jgi:hypothetical protein
MATPPIGALLAVIINRLIPFRIRKFTGKELADE